MNFVNLITKLIKLELDIMNEFLYLLNFNPTTMMLNLLLILRCAAYGNECDCSKKKQDSNLRHRLGGMLHGGNVGLTCGVLCWVNRIWPTSIANDGPM